MFYLSGKYVFTILESLTRSDDLELITLIGILSYKKIKKTQLTRAY